MKQFSSPTAPGRCHTRSASFHLASLRPLVGLLAAVLACLCTAGIARATERPPVEVRILDEGSGALPGVPFTGTLELFSPIPMTLDALALRGREGSPAWIDDPGLYKSRGTLELRRGEPRRLRFTFTARSADDHLVVEFEAAGQPMTKTFDLSQATYLAGKYGRATTVVPGVSPGPVVAPRDERGLQPLASEAGFSRSVPEEKRADLDAPRAPGKAATAYNLRVYGRFVYYQPGVSGAIGAHGATVRVYDEDLFTDQLLAVTATDENGNFDITFNYTDSEAPDLYVQFEAANNRVQVEEASLLQNNYRWNTSVWDNYTGTVLDIGTHQPANEGQRPALHILNQLTRAWIYVDSEGWDTPTVDAQWPDGNSGAWYNGAIHISSESEWHEPTIVHEWGHHWIKSFARQRSPSYCNGYCDTPTCGHCAWCPETDGIAYSEGWPDWLSEHLTRYFGTRYTPGPLSHYSFESLNECFDGTNLFLSDPLITEGPFAAFLLDLEDSAQDDHPEYSLGIDALDFSFAGVLGYTDSYEPETALQFIQWMLSVYPSITEGIWDTAINCGYEVDETPPGAPVGFASPTHAVGIPSPDNTVFLNWTEAPDDASGVGGYSLLVTTTGAAMPDTLADMGRLIGYSHPPLAPGTWYFNLRAQDRSGKWSTTYATYGPVIISDPTPVNLVYRTDPSWSRPLIPHPAPDVVYTGPGGSYIADPDSLGPAFTYLNMFAYNAGGQTTPVGPSAIYYVDEESVWESNWVALGPGADMVATNMGPFASAPGRHVLHSWLDGYEWIAETDESDNFEGHQWVWKPQTLTAGVPLTLDRPPGPYDGWVYVNDGQVLFMDMDGFRYTPTGYWQAVVLHPLNPAADLDVYLFDPSTGADSGFDNWTARSIRNAGQLDATLVNGNVVAWNPRDVGVNNYGGSDGSYQLTYVNSQTIPQDTPTTVNLGVDEMLFAREFEVTSAGLYTVHVQTADPQVPVELRWFPADFQMGGLADASASARTDSTGVVDLELNVSLTGWNGVVVFREPGTGGASLDVQLEVGPTKPDLHYVDTAGWYAPIVPRAAADATAGNTPAPAQLTGNAASTWINTALINDGSMVSSFDAGIYLDGDVHLIDSHLYIDQPPQVTAIVNNKPIATPIPGGRHTLVGWVDPSDLVLEQTELDNLHGEQWIWSPWPLTLDSTITRAEPSNRMGGIDGMTTLDPFYFNCDGLRTPWITPGQPGPLDGAWAAVAIMPDTTSDLDLRVHAVSTGAKNGFDDPLAVSAWGQGQSDFVLANLGVLGPTQFDVGVVNLGVDGGSYRVQTVVSSHRADHPNGVYGAYTLGAGEIVQLHTFTLLAAEYDIVLENLSGNIDWGMTIHPSGLSYAGKSDELPAGTAWFAGPGQNESLTVAIAQEGVYLLSVWKAKAHDLDASGSYQLRLLPKSTAVEDHPAVPRRSALASIMPNPFNPSTQITFDLARPGRVELWIYDVRGKLIRTLLTEARPAGRHSVLWNGRDDTGRVVSSGVYFVRMLAAGVDDRKKVTLLK